MMTLVLSFRGLLGAVLVCLLSFATLASPSLGQTSNKEYNSATAEELRHREKRIVESINRTLKQYRADHDEINRLVRAKWTSLHKSQIEIYNKGFELIEDTIIDAINPLGKLKKILDPNGTIGTIGNLVMYAQWADFIRTAYNHEMLKKDYTELIRIIDQKRSRFNAQIGVLKGELVKLEADKQRARSAGLLPPGGRYEPLTDNFTIRSPDRRGEAEWEFFPATLELTTMDYELTSDEPEFELVLESADADDVARALLDYVQSWEGKRSPEPGIEEENRLEITEDVTGERQEASFRYHHTFTFTGDRYDGVRNTWGKHQQRWISDKYVIVKSQPDYLVIEWITEREWHSDSDTPLREESVEPEFYVGKRK